MHISCSGLPCRLHAENNSRITETVGIAVLLLPPLGVVKLCKFSESRQGIRGEPGFTGFNQCAGISKTWATATHKRIISCTHVLGSFKIHQRHEMHGSPQTPQTWIGIHQATVNFNSWFSRLGAFRAHDVSESSTRCLTRTAGS